jgi:hypothetical protein
MTFDLTSWTVLQASARDPTLTAALAGRVADPLWMLARQWQSGELDGTDGGRPVTARIESRTSSLALRRSGAEETAVPFDPARESLEALTEPDPDAVPGAWQAAAGGRRLAQILAATGLATHTDALRQRWPLDTAADPGDRAGARTLGLLAPGLADGATLADDVREAFGADGTGAWPPNSPDFGTDELAVRGAVLVYLAWWEARNAPAAGAAWVPERLRYALDVATADDDPVALHAGDHRGGALDWTAWDAVGDLTLEADGVRAPAKTTVRTVLPAPVTFKGAPAARWWEIEDGAVALARVDAGADELAKLLFLEFTLVYGNDFFLIPLPLPVGSLTEIDSLVVTDGFGVRTLVRSADDVDGETSPWRLWATANQAPEGSPGSGGFLAARLLAPAPGPVLDGEPVEDVRLVRDEQAAMAWAVERRVPGALGRGLDRDAATHVQAPPSSPASADAVPAYTLARTPPPWWYPLLPEQTGIRAITLGLARVASADGLQPAPESLLLADPDLTIDEEAVPRSGARVVARPRLTRSPDGTRYAWTGRRVDPGGGEGHSGLAYDDVSLPPAPSGT